MRFRAGSRGFVEFRLQGCLGHKGNLKGFSWFHGPIALYERYMVTCRGPQEGSLQYPPDSQIGGLG